MPTHVKVRVNDDVVRFHGAVVPHNRGTLRAFNRDAKSRTALSVFDFATFLSRTIKKFVAAFVLMLSVSEMAAAQKAVFSGTILADSSEKPIPNAEIVFTELNRSVRTDNDGNFTFSGLPVGKHLVTVRVVGFQPVTSEVTLVDGKPLDVEMILRKTSTILKNVEVTAVASPWERQLRDFEGRRKMGIGKFLTAEDIEKEDGRPLSAFMQSKIPGLKILSLNSERFLSSSRGVTLSGLRQPGRGNFKKYPPGCYMQVIVDRRVEYNGLPEQEPFDIDRLNSREIIGIEYYTTASTPVQYSGTLGPNSKSCGTVIIWTKGG